MFGRDELSPILSFSAASHCTGLASTITTLSICATNMIFVTVQDRSADDKYRLQIDTFPVYLQRHGERITKILQSTVSKYPTQSIQCQNYVFLIWIEWWDIYNKMQHQKLFFFFVSRSYPHKDAQIKIILQAFKAFISSRALEQCSVI